MVANHSDAYARHVEARHQRGDRQRAQIIGSGRLLRPLDRGHVVGRGASLGRHRDRQREGEKRQSGRMWFHLTPERGDDVSSYLQPEPPATCSV
jgi:hypothetical protein